MMNYIFNSMNARSVANKIIDREEAYINTKFDSLSFDEKCLFVCEYDATQHPLVKIRDMTAEFSALREELVEYTKENCPPFYLYVLAILTRKLSPENTGWRELMARAYELGEPNATLFYADKAVNRRSGKSHEMVNYVINFISLADEPDENMLFRAYTMMTGVGQTPDDRSHFKSLQYELGEKLAHSGFYLSLPYLCTKDSSQEMSDETLFWRTVRFLVDSALYDRHSVCLCDSLGRNFFAGRGCEIDTERGKRFYLDVYFRHPLDREKTIAALESEFEVYRKRIVMAVLDEDKAEVERLLDEVIKKLPHDAGQLLSAVYYTLRRA